MVLIVRTDLNMQGGKTAAQCGHATLGVYKRSLKRKPEYVEAWEARNQVKIALKVESEELMDAVEAYARERGLVTYIVTDAGRTQVAPGSRTVLGIGPAPTAEIDAVTGRNGKFPLRLLN